jgi:hypothetical protein
MHIGWDFSLTAVESAIRTDRKGRWQGHAVFQNNDAKYYTSLQNRLYFHGMELCHSLNTMIPQKQAQG